MYKQIKHQEQAQRFELIQDGITAYLSYQRQGDVIDFNHTIVPKALGGQGIGTELVKFALAYARVNQLTVIPSCSFVAHYIKKHPEAADLSVNS